MARAEPTAGTPVVLPADRRFLHAVVVNGAAHGVQALQGFLLLVVLARLGGRADVGGWSVVLAVASLGGLVAHLSLPGAMVRFAALPNAAVAARNVRTATGLGLAGAAAFAGVGALLAPAIAQLVGEPQLSAALRIGALLVIGHVLVAMGSAALSARDRRIGASLLQIVGAAVEFGAAVAVFGLTRSLEGALIAYALARIAHGAVHVAVSYIVTSEVAADGERARTMLAYAIPTLPMAIGIWALGQSDRLILGRYGDVETLGVYAAAAAVANMLFFLSAPLNAALFPQVVRLWHAGEREKAERYLSHAAEVLALVALPAVVGMMLLSDMLLAGAFSVRVAVGGPAILTWSAVGAGIWMIATPWSIGLRVVDRTAAMGMAAILGAAAAVAGALLLTPSLGAVGTALGRVLGYALTLGALAAIANGRVRIAPRVAVLARAVAAALAMALAVLATRTYAPFSGVWALIACIVVGFTTYAGTIYLMEAGTPREGQVARRFLHPVYWRAQDVE